MISYPSVEKRDIRFHYDLSTLFYRLLWGSHIHHGLWEADESPPRAQQQLTDYLVTAAAVPHGGRVLDVGCGMGGSSVYLAAEHGCEVTGLTLSRFQRRWAQFGAVRHGVRSQTRFLQQDAETAEFAPCTFDTVWSIECTEHLFDKPAFFRRAAGWLKPGGRMAIHAWLAGDEPQSDGHVQQVRDVCEGFLCPSLGTAADYTSWMTEAGLQALTTDDLTERVTRTWEICEQRVKRSGVSLLARIMGVNTNRFVNSFRTILEAYESGAMKYGCFVAEAPSE